MHRIALALFVTPLVFADVADLNFDLSSLPSNAVVSSATLFISQSSNIQVFFTGGGANVFDGNCYTGFYRPAPCPDFSQIGSESWSFSIEGTPFDVLNSTYSFSINGPGFPVSTVPPISIDPRSVPVDGDYRVSIDPQFFPGALECNDFRVCGFLFAPGGVDYGSSGTANGTLDLQYALGSNSYNTSVSATTQWSFVTPEPNNYGLLVFAIGCLMVFARWVLASARPSACTVERSSTDL